MTRVIIDGRPASAFGGPPQFAAEGLARLGTPTACCWCGGSAGPGSRMTRVDRIGVGETAWRTCPSCTSAAGLDLVGQMLDTHLDAPGPVAAVGDLVARRAVPWFYLSGRASGREERTSPAPAPWHYPEAEAFAHQVAHVARARGLWS